MRATGPFFVTPLWKIALHDAGIDPRRVLRRAALPLDLFRARARLSTEAYFRLWQAIDDEGDDPALALRIGGKLTTEGFDPPIFAALCSPDLRIALDRFARYKSLLGAATLQVTHDARGSTLGITWPQAALDPPPLLVLFELVFFVRLARLATRHEIRPLEVGCPIVPVRRADFTRYFGVAMRRSATPRLRFAAIDAARPFLTANEAMWRVFEQDFARRMPELERTTSVEDRVHAVLLELLPSGNATMADVAAKLGTSTRTLQRHLQDEGASFQAVLDATRESLAKHYLRSTTMAGAEIAFLLGYEEPSSFVRAFQAWTGTSPERARRELRRRGAIR